MVLSKKMGVGAIVCVPGRCLNKNWGERVIGSFWATSTIHGKVIEILPPLPSGHMGKSGKSQAPRGKIEIPPRPTDPPGTAPEHIIVDLLKVKLVTPGNPALFLSATTAAAGGGAASTAGAGAAASAAMDTDEEVERDELEEEEEEEGEEDIEDIEENEYQEEAKVEAERTAELASREKPPPKVTVTWKPWGPILHDARAAAGFMEFNDYSLPGVDLSNASPLTVFRHFFPLAIITNAVLATNQTGTRKYGGASWEDIDDDTFMLFIGYWLAMGVRHETRRDRWRRVRAHPIFTGDFYGLYGFSCRRFDRITAALSFIPNTAAPPGDIEQVRALQTAFNEHMAKIYTPSWLVCVDEAMVPWYRPGKCPVWLNIKDKPTSRGMEFHTTSDHKTNVIFRTE